jgi:hypothetical protein
MAWQAVTIPGSVDQGYQQLLLKSQELHTEEGPEQVAPTRTDGAENGKGCDVGYVPAIAQVLFLRIIRYSTS